MTIEAGVLSLRIQEQGADQVLSKLDAIDKKAMAMGKAMSSPSGGLFNPQTATAINGQMGQMAVNFQRVTQATDAYQGSVVKLAMAHKAFTQQQTTNPIVTPNAITQTQGMVAALQKLGQQYFTIQAITRTTGAIFGWLNNQIDLGDNLHDLAIRTGVSVQTLSMLAPAAEKAGVGIDNVANGFQFMNRSVEKALSGNKEAVTAFKDLGISVEDLKGKNPEEIFHMLATAITNLDDPFRRATDAQAIFGRGGKELLPLLQDMAGKGFDEAAESAKRFGAMFGPDFANKADKFHDDLTDLKTAFSGLGIAIASDFLPPATKFVEWLTNVASKMIGVREKIGMFQSGFLWQLTQGAVGSPGGAGMMRHVKAEDAGFDALMKEFMAPKQPPRARGDGAEAVGASIPTVSQAGKSDLVDIIGFALPPFDEKGNKIDRTAPKGKLKGVKGTPAEALADANFGRDEDIKAALDKKREFIGGLLQNVAESIGGAFSNAFSAAFQGGNFLAELGKSLLSSLGGMIVQLGESMLTYGTLMAVGAPLLMATPFAAQAMSAPAAIAAGIGLIALGAGMGAIGGKGGGKGGSAGGSASHGSGQNQQDNTFALAFDPDRKLRKSKAGSVVGPNVRGLDSSAMPEGRPAVQIGVLNALHPDDPRWQRAVAETVNNAQGRGLIKKKAS